MCNLLSRYASSTEKRSTPVPPTEETKTSPGVIAAAVIVPAVVLIAVAVAVVLLVKRRDITRAAYMKQGDDGVLVVDDE